MDFAPSARATEMLDRLQAFIDRAGLPGRAGVRRAAAGCDRRRPAARPAAGRRGAQGRGARSAGCGTCSCPRSSGLSLLDYAPLAELSGWSPELAPEAMNCAAPDTGNMEVLHLVGTDEQKAQWLEPLLAGEIRSGFAMTEPDVASSDARNIATSIRRDGDEYVVNGRKWWTTGCGRPAVRGADRDGPHRPGRRRLPAAVDGAGADGRAGRDAGAVAAGVRLPRPARPRRDRASTTCGCRSRNLLGERGRRLRDRAGPARARAGCTTACGRSGWPSARCELMVAAGARPRGVRPAAGRARRGGRADRRGPDGDRAGPAAGAQDRLADRHRRACRPPRRRSPRSRWSCRGWPARSSTTRSRCTAAPASATTSRWPRCTPVRAPCGSPTAPTRCTSARSPAPSSSARRLVGRFPTGVPAYSADRGHREGYAHEQRHLGLRSGRALGERRDDLAQRCRRATLMVGDAGMQRLDGRRVVEDPLAARSAGLCRTDMVVRVDRPAPSTGLESARSTG